MSRIKQIDWKLETKRELARRNHFDFIKYCWQRTDPFIEAKENPFQIQICQEIDLAIDNYKKGISTALCIKVPFRHGKSDIISRYLSAHFLGELPDKEVLLVSYAATLSELFSRFGRDLVRNYKYKELYPSIDLAKDTQSVTEWGIVSDKKKTNGRAQFSGLFGGVTGKGGDLIIVDDFCEGREDAESETIRNKAWDEFTSNVMTRKAPTSIVVILATPWHTDDIFGRIKKHMEADDRFPRFKELKFPAIKSTYHSGVLFPERFGQDWYEAQKATLGVYGMAGLLQCDPEHRGSNFLRTDKITIVEPTEWIQKTSHLRFVRGWDLASSSKQTAKEDPDFTSGCKLAVVNINTAIKGVVMPILFIDDYVRGQWEAPERDKMIIQTSMNEERIAIGGEAFAGYKDAYMILKNILSGFRSITKVNLPGDKRAKAQSLVPIFEAGNVYMKKAPWNEAVIKQFREFDGGKHDDDVDSLAVAYAMYKRETKIGYVPGV